MIRLSKEPDQLDIKYKEKISGILLSAWGANKKENYLPNEEYRELLVESNESFLIDTLHNLNQFIKREHESEQVKWQRMLSMLFNNVWPLQIAFRTHSVASSIVEVLLNSGDSFIEAVDSAKKHLIAIPGNKLHFHTYRFEKNNVIERYPEKSLALIYLVLTKNPNDWPYSIEKILDLIVEADHTLENDVKFIELRRKWNSR